MAKKEVKDQWVVFYWPDRAATGLVFEDKEQAEASASVRNGLLLHIAGGVLAEAWDFYRRDDEGRPMPAKLRVQKNVSPSAPWPIYGLGGAP